MGEIILGADTGLASFGFTIMEDGQILDCGDIGVAAVVKKKRAHFADDFASRFRTLARRLRKIFKRYRPTHVAYEAFTFPRSSSAAAKSAGGAVALIALSVDWRATLRPILHQEINEWLGKKARSRKERKELIAEKVLTKWPNHPWPRTPKSRKVPDHVTDAAGVADVLRLILLGHLG